MGMLCKIMKDFLVVLLQHFSKEVLRFCSTAPDHESIYNSLIPNQIIHCQLLQVQRVYLNSRVVNNW